MLDTHLLRFQNRCKKLVNSKLNKIEPVNYGKFKCDTVIDERIDIESITNAFIGRCTSMVVASVHYDITITTIT